MKTAPARTGSGPAFFCLLCLLAMLFLPGCASSTATRPTLPDHREFVPEQIVLHGDVAIPGQDRLVSELTAHRVELSRELALPPSDELIHVYVFDYAEEFNEYRRLHCPDSPPGRAFFRKRDSRLEIDVQRSDRLPEDLRHEVTHAYLRAVLRARPLWLDEGLAEYYELPRERHGVNRPHVDLLVDRLARGTWQPDLARLESLDAAAAMTQLDYAECWAWVHLLLHAQPARAEVLREYLGELRRTGHARPLSDRLRAGGGDLRQELVTHLHRLAASGP